MKKLKSIVLFPLAIILLSSCEEEFNPYGEFKESYIFNCIIRGDTTFQIATLDRNYVADGLNPYDNHVDPALKGAVVRIWYGDSVKILKYGEMQREDTSRYTTPFSYYYADNFLPPANTNMEVEVLLPNGKKLNSSTHVPEAVYISNIYSDKIIPPVDKDYLQMRWALEKTNQIYVPFLYINYFKKVNGVNIRHRMEVPVHWEKSGDLYLPKYPIASDAVAIIYEMDVIDIAMEQISAGDPNKSDYTILAATFHVLALDDFLSTYYSATNIASSGFSIKLDETDFTNIDGGYGIFGSFTMSKYAAKFTHRYIESFGYKPGLTE